MKRLISKSTLALLVFSHPGLTSGDDLHPIAYLETLLRKGHPDLNEMTQYIDIGRGLFKLGTEQSSQDPRLGIFAPEALRLSLRHIHGQWTLPEIFHLFQSLSSVHVVRCGSTAVIFNLQDDKRYIVIFHQRNLTHHFFEETAA